MSNSGVTDEQVLRVMGLDYGSKTVGIAISDILGVTAQPVETVFRKKENHLRRTLARIDELIEEYHISKIVVGNPIYEDGGIGERARLSAAFAKKLRERTHLPVLLWDERESTAFAERSLISQQVRREDRKKYVDQIAAVFILQGYLDFLHNEVENNETRRTDGVYQ